jgi:hypothetical protein
MTRPITTSGVPGTTELPTVPDDVQKFAEEHGISEYLPALIDLMGRIVPGRLVSLRLECDPSIPDDWYIVLSIDIEGLTADDLFSAHEQWVKGLIALCPPDARHFFHFGM